MPGSFDRTVILLLRRGQTALFAALGVAAALVALFWSTGEVRADTVVTDCTRAGVQAALSAGGVVTFNCGPADSVTIPISPTLIVSGTVTLDGGNKVTLDGGGATRIISMTAGSSLTLNNIALGFGSADGQGGGAIRVGDGATLRTSGASFGLNRAVIAPNASGGAIYGAPNSSITVAGGEHFSNTAKLGGLVYSEGALSASGLFVLFNSAESGGAVFAKDISISGSGFGLNSATAGFGGALFATSTLTVSASNFISNTSTMGGGAVFAITATIDSSQVLSNTSNGAAGGVLAQDLTVSRSKIVGNSAGGAGGGLGSFGTVTITESTLEGNNAKTTGGGAFAASVLIDGSTIVSNTATEGLALGPITFGGGGVAAFGPASIANSTFAANSTISGAGGGLIVSSGDLANVTFSDNSAGQNGGAVLYSALAMTNATVIDNGTKAISGFLSTSPFTLTNSIVGGTGAPYCSGTGKGLGRNLIQDFGCVDGALALGSLNLGPLQNNGGSTPTRAPLAGSAAIVAATFALCPPTDQRGLTRTNPCDIGAYETGIAPAITTISPTLTAAVGPTFTLTVNGSGFIPGTIVLWNGAPRQTTLLNSTQLNAEIPAADILASGSVTVKAAYGQSPDGISNGLTFTIVKASQTITFSPLAERTLSQSPFTLTATASSGLTVAYSASGVCTVAGASVTLVGPGTCTITASQAGDASYAAATPVQRSFTVKSNVVSLPAVQVNRTP